MSSEFASLLERLARCPGAPGEISEGFRKAVAVCEIDPEMSLTRSRKVLEFVVRDLYERRIQEPPGTRPLENLLQRLTKDELIPTRLEAYATTVRKLGNVGTHTFGEPVNRDDVFQSLSQLLPILEWYYPAEAATPEDNGNFLAQALAQPTVRTKTEAAPPILPKGLRSFDSADSDFYLRLLPGPFDAEGLPESIRFWKSRLEQTEELPFTVGMIYGPSGCGKSSVVKAGLLPRLAAWIPSLYVEATAHNTEPALAAAIARKFPECGQGSLAERLARLRDSSASPRRRILIVIDQFEQWLAAHDDDDEETELLRALRQCDGQSLFAIVLVRDDFWMAASRFMRRLGLPLLEGRNCQAIDLFDPRHARNVLMLFGQAYGALPPESSALEPAQREFLEEAVRGLADDGKIICVRLALFAEMIKGQPWTPQTLEAVGGARGVGVTFLEETFGRTAPSRRKRHELAARNVLEALLPDRNAAIKGRARSHAELLAASGYADRPDEFAELLQLLNQELRLIAPTQHEELGTARTEGAARTTEPSYQLTHDYLVPSVREWIERRQRQSRRGRAELLLAEQSRSWNERPEPRRLPTLWEWFSVRRYVPRNRWTEPQQAMMRAGGWRLTTNAMIWVLVAVIAAFGALAFHEHEVTKERLSKAAGLVDQLLVADSSQVPAVLEEMAPYRDATTPLLQEKLAEPNLSPESRVYAQLALSPEDPRQLVALREDLLTAPAERFELVRRQLKDQSAEVTPWLQERLEAHVTLPADVEFLRLVQTLALYDPQRVTSLPAHAWPPFTRQVLRSLADDPKLFGQLADDLRPVRTVLFEPLLQIMREGEMQSDRERATALLAELGRDQPEVLVQGLLDADTREFERLFGALAPQQAAAKEKLHAFLALTAAADATYADRELLARRQASAAVALWLMGERKTILPLLAWSADPGRRTYIIHWLGQRGATAASLVEQLHLETDLSIRRALLYAVHECSVHPLEIQVKEDLSAELTAAYRTDADPGIHAAIDWMLRSWGHEGKLQSVAQDLAKEWSREKLAEVSRGGKLRWFVNSRGQTFSAIPSPATFTMGSPPNEVGRQTDAKQLQETQHPERIGRHFAIATKQVTVAEFQEFLATKPPGIKHSYWESYAPTPECSQTAVTWFEAAAYCRWLSEQEKVPEEQMCFPPIDKILPGLVLPENYLSRQGYRMPTEAEWEYACRAGATTARFHGETDTMLPKYAIYERNTRRHTEPGGTLKGNDWGLFDMLGNGWDWCLSPAVEYATPGADGVVNDTVDLAPVNSLPERILRGGGLSTRPEEVRSACRFRQKADARLDYVVFRLALTLPPEPAATAPAPAPK